MGSASGASLWLLGLTVVVSGSCILDREGTLDASTGDPSGGTAGADTSTGGDPTGVGGSVETSSGGAPGAGGGGGLPGVGGAGGSGGAPGPVCGNDILERGEECDDHNTAPLDGCSATCTVEDADECETAPLIPLVPGTPVMISGNTSGETDSFTSVGCSSNATWYGSDHVYAVEPQSSGQISITLNATYDDWHLFVRAGCPGTTHLACSFTNTEIDFQATANTVYHVFVDSWQSTSGSYTATIELQ